MRWNKAWNIIKPEQNDTSRNEVKQKIHQWISKVELKNSFNGHSDSQWSNLYLLSETEHEKKILVTFRL